MSHVGVLAHDVAKARDVLRLARGGPFLARRVAHGPHASQLVLSEGAEQLLHRHTPLPRG
jgi:hypothetical protein